MAGIHSTQVRFKTIDVLRALAALSVLLYHASRNKQLISSNALLHLPTYLIDRLFSYGHVGVTLFFVISGFCIHLQWAKSYRLNKNTKLPFLPFWKKRLRRIYPPYLFAMIFYLILFSANHTYDLSLKSSYDIGLHLLMIHNLDSATVESINPSFWSLAVEEQLYLAYFLFLILRIHFGWKITLIVAAVVKVLWYFLCLKLNTYFQINIPLTETAQWYWLTWILGAISIENLFGIIELPKWCSSGWVCLFTTLLVVAITEVGPKLTGALAIFWLLIETQIWGLAFFVLINRFIKVEKLLADQSLPFIKWIIKLFANIGIFSYSIYLIHHSSFYLLSWAWLTPLPDILPEVLFEVLVIAPFALFMSWVFFYLFERPFISISGRSQQ